MSNCDLPVPKTFVVPKESPDADEQLDAPLKDLGSRLWVKPRTGFAGIGSEEWQLKDGKYRKSDEPWLKAIEVLRHLRAKADLEKCDQLVQERLTNHPSLEELSNGALCVLRAVTISTPNGDPLLVLAYMDLPCGEAHRWSSAYRC